METAKKGIPRQMLARQSEARAFQASPRKLTLLLIRPQSLRIQEIGLRTPSKSISQARLLIAVGTIHGSNSPARQTRLKLKRSLSSRARPRPRKSLNGTVTKP